MKCLLTILITLVISYSTNAQVNLEDCLQLDTNKYDCLILVAQENYDLGNLTTAKNTLKSIEKYNIETIESNSLLLKILLYEKNYEVALQVANNLKKQRKSDVFSLKQIANIFIKQNKLDSADTYYQKAFIKNENDQFLIQNWAEVLIQLKKFPKADQILTTALYSNPNNYTLQYLNINNLYKQKKYATVIDKVNYLDSLIELPYLYKKLIGYSYFRTGAYVESIKKLVPLIQKAKNPEQMHSILAKAYWETNNLDTALIHFDLAIKSGISDFISNHYSSKANIFKEQGNWKAEIQSLKEVNYFQPTPSNLYFLASAYEKYYKDKTVAINFYKKILSHPDVDKKLYKTLSQKIKY